MVNLNRHRVVSLTEYYNKVNIYAKTMNISIILRVSKN